VGKVNRNVCPTFLAFALGAATGAHALGQALGAPDQLLHPQGGAAPSFEVASVKPNHNPDNVFSLRLLPAGFKADGAPLDRLIRFAYDVKSDQQVLNMPDWANSEHFDIDAKISDADVAVLKKLTPDQSFQQYRLMLQSLLSNRFRMKVRTEARVLPVYALAVARHGLKLTPAAELPETHRLPQLSFHASGDLRASSVTMEYFAEWLSGKPDTGGRVVIDATGLKGSYDFGLLWEPVDYGTSSAVAGVSQPAGSTTTEGGKPPLFTAIQEQLGLKLEPRKAPVEVLVIDHVEQPSPN
jgi:bla regulator protein BlaR1